MIAEFGRPLKELFGDRIQLSIRKRNEILTNRGGEAPNKNPEQYKTYKMLSNAGCVLPFRQMVIRPNGEISLCCQDALGQITLGDIKANKLTDVWYGPTYTKLRKQLLSNGRKNLKLCKVCDLPSVDRNDVSMSAKIVFNRFYNRWQIK